MAARSDGRSASHDWLLKGSDAIHQHPAELAASSFEDCQLQSRYVSYLDIDEGKIDLGQFKLFILTEALALSDKLVAALKQFVLDGGTLLADGRVGRMTANCRQVECGTGGLPASGLLDDLFGIRHGPRINLKAGKKLVPVDGNCPPLGQAISELTALDSDVRLAPGSGAEALAMAGLPSKQAPALIRRRVGKGLARVP